MCNGRLESIEQQSGVVPYKIGSEIFEKCFILVDGIYPEYGRFAKGYKQPITENEKKYTKWQEGARKEIERAFAILQSKFQFVCRPILLHNINHICKRMGTCIKKRK